MLFSQREIFTYAGINCTEFGIINGTISSGMNDEMFTSNRTIKEVKIRGRKAPYLSEIEQDPFEFSLTLIFDNGFTEEQLHKVREWLLTDTYQPLYFNNHPELIYYCTPVNSSGLTHNSLYQGYITIQMRCDSPFAYSPVTLSPNYIVQVSREIDIMNHGTDIIKPEIWIKRIGKGNVEIENFSMSQPMFQLLDIENGETVYIDNENKDIVSDILGMYRYDNFNDNYLTLTTGSNRLKIYGDCEVVFRYQFKYALG